MTERALTLAAIVLAAGASGRLGQPKQAVTLCGETLLVRTVNLATSLADVVACRVTTYVIVGANAGSDREALTGLDVAIHDNPDWRDGQASSLTTGIVAAGSATGALVLLVDQYRVTANALAKLVKAWADDPTRTVAARYAGVIGAPAIWPRRHFASLCSLTPARELLTEVQPLTVPLAAAAYDLDTPDDLLGLRDYERRRG